MTDNTKFKFFFKKPIPADKMSKDRGPELSDDDASKITDEGSKRRAKRRRLISFSFWPN